MSMRRKIVVTGGLGFIGSNFIRYWLTHHDDDLINLDKQTYAGNPATLSDIEANPRYQWVKGDIADLDVVAGVLAQADVVVHFAAETHVDRSIDDPEAFLRTNVVGTYVLLEAARKVGVKRFIHVSTDEVYGSVPTGDSVETDPLLPNSPYAASKASSDLMARAFFVTHGVPVIITRCSNNFGPYQFPEKALPLLITNAMDDLPFPLYGKGDQIRDWLFVEDHVRAIACVLDHGVLGEIYNIGGTCSMPNLELFQHVLRSMGKSLSLIRHVEDRQGHDQRYALCCDKLRALGWAPHVDFEQALTATIAWYQTQRAWWEPIKRGDDFQAYYTRQYAKRWEAVGQ